MGANISISMEKSNHPDLNDIPYLIEEMLKYKGEKSIAAAKRIYDLSDKDHYQNRIPMVCSGKWDVLTPLAKCLTQDGDGRHLACLALNNLSIPTENKSVIALGPAGKDLIDALCKIIAEDKQGSYLCCIILMNLSFLKTTITSILNYSPSFDGSVIAPLSNPNSLIRVLENLLVNSSTPSAGSGKAGAVRWACGLIKNLSKSEENAILIGNTEIPNCIVKNLRNNITTPPSSWATNSLEDFSLFIVLNLAQWDGCNQVLIDAETINIVRPIMCEDGDNLQGIKATMACALLRAERIDFPEDSQQLISNLVSNIVAEKGMTGQYTHGIFELYTATKALEYLTKSANSVDVDVVETNNNFNLLDSTPWNINNLRLHPCI